MIADDIRPGDQCLADDGTVAYTVTGVRRFATVVAAEVRYRDGGQGYREWRPGAVARLTRPTQPDAAAVRDVTLSTEALVSLLEQAHAARDVWRPDTARSMVATLLRETGR